MRKHIAPKYFNLVYKIHSHIATQQYCDFTQLNANVQNNNFPVNKCLLM